MTYEEYRSAVDLTLKTNPDWRYGQTMFNVLHEIRPDLSEQVRATNLDPFYKNTYNGVYPFLQFIQENW